MPSKTRRVGLAAAATSFAVGATLTGAAPASAEADFKFDRVEGADRYETAAKAAEKFGQANTVILASGQRGRYPDALTANYLAGLENAPVLLTKLDETPEATKQAIKASGAKNVIIVGGTGVVSQEQEDRLGDAYDVRRISGDDRWGTAAAVIAEGNEAQGDTALLATGTNFPDALGGGPVSYAEKMPLAITKTDDVPDNVVEELKQAGINKVVIIGGKGVVSDAVVEELKGKGITLEARVGGVDRAETSALVAQYALDHYNFKATAANVASGFDEGDGADALGGAPLSGKADTPLLITMNVDKPGAAVLDYLGKHSDTLTQGIIFGGTGAVSETAEYEMTKAALGSGAHNARTGEFYNEPQAAIAEAEKGDTIHVFGKDLQGFTVNKPGLDIKGEDATVNGGIQIQSADGTSISGFTITPGTVAGEVAGFYLADASDVVISGNTVLGESNNGAGVINATGGPAEAAEIHHNEFKDLRQGVFANPSADFKITVNEFRNNTAGSANDAASVITGNKFINNDEGVGLGVKGSEVKDNYFANNSPAHVGDYTTDSDYDLKAMIDANRFDEPVVVDPEQDAAGAPEFIRDKS